ncbi:hypothetical protein [Halorubrum laminariae]|uniref:Uncharacterized protein n=1 Tax=Halorubrum laminariae TaxID=1433523 RepID=A0ABD6C236_9EURY|nr:hypothetical protein [Halorubrum laminariae]
MSGPRGRCGRPGDLASDEGSGVDTGSESGGTKRPTAGSETVVSSPETILGRIPTGTSLRRELAAAARSRGRESSVRAELIDLHERFAAIATPPIDLDAARRHVADTGGEEERLKEQIAAFRGDVRARRAVGAETDEALAELESAAAALAAVQTDRIAAEQALDRALAQADHARDTRERRLELRDRLENRRRDACDELARGIYPAFHDALADVPGGCPNDAGADPSAYDGPRLAASLAAVRIAELDSPVTVDEAAIAWVNDHGGRIETVIDTEVICQRGTPGDLDG